MDFKSMSNEALAAALAQKREAAKALFALTEPTVDQVNEVETLLASATEIEAEQAERAAVVKDATDRFAAARDAFTASAEDEDAESDDEPEDDEDGDDESDAAEADVPDAVEAAAKPAEGSAAEEDAESPAEEADEKKAMAASARGSQKIGASRKVARKVARPAVQETSKVTITAAADVQGFSTGQALDGMEAVTKALQNRIKGFGKYNAQAARQANQASGGEPVLNKFGVASFGINFDGSLVASAGNEYAAVQAAFKQDRFSEQVLTAGGWCAPSENVYSFIADYVVDGLITVPEVSAPRGGLNITTGPRVGGESQGANLDAFGFTQTEAQAIAGDEKTCETIECPPFVDHRLDAIGYCFKIPILTQKAYPEVVTDALRFANVLYAHKVNRRIINDLVALSDAVTYSGYGPSFTDALEALSFQAVKERRKWNIGENANMEVKLPSWVKEVFRADMSRRAAVTFDSVTDQMIAKHFTDRHLAVEYVADWQELRETNQVNIVLPGTFKAMMYPSGTFIKAVEDVINLSAVYDAASLTVNEYTGIFFEQGIMTAKAGYGSSLITIPVNTAGQMGALDLTGFGDFHANGSF